MSSRKSTILEGLRSLLEAVAGNHLTTMINGLFITTAGTAAAVGLAPVATSVTICFGLAMLLSAVGKQASDQEGGSPEQMWLALARKLDAALKRMRESQGILADLKVGQDLKDKRLTALVLQVLELAEQHGWDLQEMQRSLEVKTEDIRELCQELGVNVGDLSSQFTTAVAELQTRLEAVLQGIEQVSRQVDEHDLRSGLDTEALKEGQRGLATQVAELSPQLGDDWQRVLDWSRRTVENIEDRIAGKLHVGYPFNRSCGMMAA
jgi:hypothetical protein